jgi:cell division transport system permease protein
MATTSYKSKRLGSYPYISVVLSVTIALLAIGVFSMLIVCVRQMSQLVRENVEVQIFLSSGVVEADISKIQQKVAQKPYIRQQNGSADIRFLHKDQAAKDLTKQLDENFIELLGENPLKHSLIVRIKADYHSPAKLKEIQTDLQKIEGVFEVEYAANMIEDVNSSVATVVFVLFGFAIFMMIIVIVLIHNTIRLALFSQRFIIRSMQLVGATAQFIRKPFLKTAILQGLGSGLAASAILYIVLRYIENVTDLKISNLYSFSQFLMVAGLLIFTGAILSIVSSYRAVNKYLGMSLDELY